MGTTKMPEWMMEYAASIGNEDKVFREFRGLSDKYYSEINKYNEQIYPVQNYNYKTTNKALGLDKGDLDPKPHLHGLEEKYKKEALKVACKYGYEIPEKESDEFKNSQSLTKFQENSRFASLLKEEDSLDNVDFSDIDSISKEAHRKYFEKHPQAAKNYNNKYAEMRWLEEAEQVKDFQDVPYPESKDIRDKLSSLESRFENKYSLNKEVGRVFRLDRDKDDLEIDID